MASSPLFPTLRPRDWGAMALLFAGSLAVFDWAAVTATARALKPLGALGVYYDGGYYLELARSFPLPFGSEALAYAGRAPLYPALIWLVRVVTPNGAVDWGMAALFANWLAAASAPVAFYLVCRTLGIAALLPSLLFVFANPRWLPLATAPHNDPLGVLFATLALLFYVRERWLACAIALSVACMARYPAVLLVVPLVLGIAIARRRIDVRELWPFALPVAVIALMHAYLYWRIPGFVSIWNSHALIWPTGFTWPFHAAWVHGGALWSVSAPIAVFTYAIIALSVASGVVGLRTAIWRPSEPHGWALALWVALIVLFHASLRGPEALTDLTRLAILAWPPTLLILWRAFGERLPKVATATLCATLAVFSLWYVRENLGWALLIQQVGDDEQRLQSDVPDYRQFNGDTMRR